MSSIKKNISQIDGMLGAIGLMILSMTIFLQIILRFVFSKPLMGAEEFTRYLVICVVFFPLAYAERSGSSIIMEEIQALFPRKIRIFINLSAHVLTTVVYGIVAASSFNVLVNNSLNKTATLEMPFWLFFLPTVVGLTAMTVVRIITVICTFKKRRLPWES